MQKQILLALFALFSISTFVQSQTPGMIVEPASGASFAPNNHKISLDENVNLIVISYGEKLNSKALSVADIEDFSWEIIVNDTSKFLGVGIEIYDVLFEKPGKFDLVLNHTGKKNNKACQHTNEKIAYRLVVQDEKYEFLFDELELSNVIVGDVETAGIVLSVPIIYSSYAKNQGELKGLKIISSGVNTSIQGDPKNNDHPLQIGKNIISFNLKGKATPNSYIMFDFYKHDNLIQTYYLPTKLNN
jgi:hypothetical protein